MKKKLLLLVVLIDFVLVVNAQDIITLKSGDEIKSIVQEIGEEYILYKKFENQNGTVYYLNTDQVFMIEYDNGTKDVFNIKTQYPEIKKSHLDESNNTYYTPPNNVTPTFITPPTSEQNTDYYPVPIYYPNPIYPYHHLQPQRTSHPPSTYKRPQPTTFPSQRVTVNSSYQQPQQKGSTLPSQPPVKK